MTASIVQQLIAQGETDRVEFKQSNSDMEAVGRTVCAFLNDKGGTLIMGVDDHGRVSGIAEPEKTLASLQRDLSEHLSPKATYSINTEVLDGKSCLVIDVPPGPEGPYVYRNGIFVRTGRQSIGATSSDISTLILRRQAETMRWERLPGVGFELADLDREEILRTAREVRERHYYELDATDAPERILERLNLMINGLVLNSAIALFAKNPARGYPQTRVRAVRFAPDAPAQMLDNRTFEGHAFALLEQLQGFLRLHLPIQSKLSEASLTRTDLPAYPWAAVRESIINALVHRDYAAYDGGVTLSLFSDRLEIWNSGTLPEGLTIEDLKQGGVSRPHNPDMAHVFVLRGLMERLGSGTRRIATECLQAGLPEPEWELRGGGVLLILRLVAMPKRANDRQALTRRQIMFLRHAELGQRITAQEYHREFAADVSARQARTELMRLVQSGFVRSEGKGPSTVYVRTAEPISSAAGGSNP